MTEIPNMWKAHPVTSLWLAAMTLVVVVLIVFEVGW